MHDVAAPGGPSQFPYRTLHVRSVARSITTELSAAFRLAVRRLPCRYSALRYVTFCTTMQLAGRDELGLTDELTSILCSDESLDGCSASD